MTNDNLNCGKCGAVLKIEKEYVTFKENNTAYRRCPGCNTTSKISFEKVKHLLNSIPPLIENEKYEENDEFIPPLIEINVKKPANSQEEEPEEEQFLENIKSSNNSIPPLIETEVIEIEKEVIKPETPDNTIKEIKADISDIFQIIEAIGVEVDELKAKSAEPLVIPLIETVENLRKAQSEIFGIIGAIDEEVDALKNKSADIGNLRNEIDLLKSDTAKVLARERKEIEYLKKSIEEQSKSVAPVVVPATPQAKPNQRTRVADNGNQYDYIAIILVALAILLILIYFNS